MSLHGQVSMLYDRMEVQCIPDRFMQLAMIRWKCSAFWTDYGDTTLI